MQGVSISDVSVQVCVFAFDLMYLSGCSLLHTHLRERVRLLEEKFPPREGAFELVPHRCVCAYRVCLCVLSTMGLLSKNVYGRVHLLVRAR